MSEEESATQSASSQAPDMRQQQQPQLQHTRQFMDLENSQAVHSLLSMSEAKTPVNQSSTAESRSTGKSLDSYLVQKEQYCNKEETNKIETGPRITDHRNEGHHSSANVVPGIRNEGEDLALIAKSSNDLSSTKYADQGIALGSNCELRADQRDMRSDTTSLVSMDTEEKHVLKSSILENKSSPPAKTHLASETSLTGNTNEPVTLISSSDNNFFKSNQDEELKALECDPVKGLEKGSGSEDDDEPHPTINKNTERNRNHALECSFTDTDESDYGNQDSIKKHDSGFFRITFDSDDDGKSDSGEFLTCSVCGKELPETVVADAGKEMCNTCKLVRTETEQTPKVKRGRKKIYEALPKNNSDAKLTLEKTLEENPLTTVPSDSSLAPLRKSTRKRISTIVIEEIVQDSDEDIGAVYDSDQDADYPHMHRKIKFSDRKDVRVNTSEDVLKSKYAQELNLAPVVKIDPDNKEGTNISEGLSIRENTDGKPDIVKRKKGRPKGSKNKPKVSRDIASIINASKRDMKFNKRWHRARGPVPDANPDATDGMWSCEFCGKGFPIRRNFLAHRRKHSGRHKCDECGETFECNSKLQRHIRRHRGEKPFACHLCPKAYSENMWLQRHLATHLAEGHTPQPKPYQCNICGRQYTHKGTMIYHVKTHTETKFYQCDVCGKQFTHRSSLECHIKTHTGEKPYVCEICGKRFADRSVQLRHTRSHSGEKPYKCTICDKGFTQSGTLNIHMRMHTSEKPYKCKVCEMGFLKRCDLTRHSKCHVGEMLTKQANLITCRVNEGRGADIQKKAAQILIDAYGEKKDDGTIEIRTRQFEHGMDSETEEISENATSEHVSSIIKSMEQSSVTPCPVNTYIMGRGEGQMLDHQSLHHEEIQRRAMEYIIMKRQELEQQEMERFQQQQSAKAQIDSVPIERHGIEHQTVKVLTEQHPSDRQIVEQQIVRHVEQNAAQRQLLEQVEGQIMEQPQQQQLIEGQQEEERQLEQMSPQQQAIWICKYN